MFFDLQANPLAVWVPVALASIYAIRNIKRRATHKLPPGPKGIPFFGNLFQMSTMPWKEFEIWKNEYGPLVYLNAAGQGILVLNSHEVAADLLDRRGSIYADRPRMIMAQDILCRGLLIFLAKYGDTWRRMRRASHEALNKTRSAQFHPVQLKEAVIFVDGMLKNSRHWQSEIHRTAASSVLSFVYDLPTVTSTTDPTVTRIDNFTGVITGYANQRNYLVEFFTWMQYIPSSVAKWKKEAEDGFEEYNALFESMFRDVQNRIKEGDERQSFSGTLIREPERHQLNDAEATWLAAAMYAAGSETSATTMIWFMLAMIAHPEKQRKCQEELDSVIGRSRMPTFADRDNLPYTQATVREALRWRAVTPIGVPHYTTQDDWYQGFFIPKGTITLANIWCMNRERTIYGEDADDFNPDRFIDEHGRLTPALADTKDEGHLSFGFGPRICVGRHVANDALFVNIASILWATTISPAKDKEGNTTIPDTLEPVNTGLVVRPLPFDCVITPRFPEATGIIAHTRELF